MPTPKSRPRRSKTPPRKHLSGPLLRLIAAVLLFAVCFTAKAYFPRQSQRWRGELTRLMGAQTDLEDAFSRLGEELERRETMVRAVGDWCVSVFGAEGVTLPTGETSSASPSEESDSAERSAGAEDGS